MTLCEPNSELHWASTRPEDNTPATAVAVGHFVQVGLYPPTANTTATFRITPVADMCRASDRSPLRPKYRPKSLNSRMIGYSSTARRPFL